MLTSVTLHLAVEFALLAAPSPVVMQDEWARPLVTALLEGPARWGLGTRVGGVISAMAVLWCAVGKVFGAGGERVRTASTKRWARREERKTGPKERVAVDGLEGMGGEAKVTG